MKQHSEPVVLEAREATPSSLDLLYAQVEALGRSVRRSGAVVVQDLGAPALETVAERADLRHLVAVPSDDGLVEEHSGNLWILGQVDVAHRPLGQPGTEEFVVGIGVAATTQSSNRIHYVNISPYITPSGQYQADIGGGICRENDGVHFDYLSPATPCYLHTDCGKALQMGSSFHDSGRPSGEVILQC